MTDRTARPSMPSTPMTMADVATLAGVSVPTVSKVLNGRPDVAAATRTRVERVISEHGFVRNHAARALRSARSGLVDLVVHDLESPYHLEIIRGVEEGFEDQDVGVVLSAVHGERKRARRWLEGVRNRSSDGAVLVLSGAQPEQMAELRAMDIPFVLLDHWGQADPGIPSVGATNWAGARDATEHLLSLGHQRIAIIGGDPHAPSAHARLAGYRAALEQAGLTPDPDLSRPGAYRAPTGYSETLALLDLERPPTAIFAGSDEQALGTLQALRERGLHAPDDISVVGFDDIPFAALTAPPLTTVRQPLVEMGRVAAGMLMQLIAGEELAMRQVELVTTLVERESTAPPGAVTSGERHR